MQTRSLSSGLELGGRFRLEDLIAEIDGAITWRAVDSTLDRSVCIQALPSTDVRVPAFCEAARRSTVVADPRFLRVLDIVEEEDGHTYLVREWARSVSLDRILRERTLSNRRSATIVADVAEAVANAHEAGVYHQRLYPSTVLLKESGAVRITGLAVDLALSGQRDDDGPGGALAEQRDVELVGRLLYASLVSRWPGSPRDGLRAAPKDHHRTLLRPRQVRAGVSRDVDTVCDRILGDPPRHGERPLRSARDVSRVLRLAGDDESFVTDDQPSLIGSSPDLFATDPDQLPVSPPPAIHPPKRRPAALAPAPPTPMQRSRAAARHATEGDRLWIAVGIGLLLTVAIIFGVLVGRSSDPPAPEAIDPTPTTGTTGAPTTADVALPIVSAADFDPQGDPPEENSELAPLAVDGQQSTGWTTLTYYNNPELGGLKSGVGLVLDLGRDRDVSKVQAVFGSSGTAWSVFTAPAGTTSPPTSLRELARQGTIESGQISSGLGFETVRTRYVLVWLRRLPASADGTGFAGDVREVTVRGTR